MRYVRAKRAIPRGSRVATIEVLEPVAAGKFMRFWLFGFIPVWRWPTQLERLLANDYQLLLKETLKKS